MMNAPLPLAVIIPVHDSEKTTAQCLASVFDADMAPSQVIVVDDGSADQSAQVAAAFRFSLQEPASPLHSSGLRRGRGHFLRRLRRSSTERISRTGGGFDESQRVLEDIEFGYRMYRTGHHILLDKTLQFTHAKRYSLIGLIKSDVFNRSIQWTKLMLRQHIFRNDLNTKTNNTLSVILAGLIAVMLPLALVTQAGAIGLIGGVILLVALNLSFYAFVF